MVYSRHCQQQALNTQWIFKDTAVAGLFITHLWVIYMYVYTIYVYVCMYVYTVCVCVMNVNVCIYASTSVCVHM